MNFIQRFIYSNNKLSANAIHASTATHKQTINEQLSRYAPLIHLQEQRQLLEAVLPHRQDSFQTLIVGLDLMQQHLVIDELAPLLADPKSLIGKQINIRHQRNRTMLDMPLTILDWSAQERCYRLTLPDHVKYSPRRHYERLTLARHSLLNTEVKPLYGAPWCATIDNISHGGMRISVGGDLRGQLSKHQLLPICRILLSNTTSIDCRGYVKAYSYFNRPYRHTEISIEFETMDSQQREELTRFLDHLTIAA